MARKRKFTEPLDKYRTRCADEHAEAERLREDLYNKLVHYAETLGEAELLRRLREDYLDDTGRVMRLAEGKGLVLLPNKPLSEDHPAVRAIDDRLAELAAAADAASP